jgi:hypothetical protein
MQQNWLPLSLLHTYYYIHIIITYILNFQPLLNPAMLQFDIESLEKELSLKAPMNRRKKDSSNSKSWKRRISLRFLESFPF